MSKNTIVTQESLNFTHKLMLRDKLSVMLGNYALITYANVVVSCLSAYVLKELFSLHILILWFVVILGVAVTRLWLHKQYFANETNATLGLVKWSRIFILSTFIASLPWCYAAWFFIVDSAPENITFLMVTLMGMAAGSIGSSGGYFPAFLSYSVPFMLVLSVRIMSIESFHYQILGYFSLSLTVGFIGFARANQKALEQALTLKYENISLVKQLEEKNQSLVEHIDKVEDANRQKSQFLAAASHDLRQPLQSLTLFSEVLQHQVKEDSARNTLDKINLSISALNSLFNALLDVSRLDAGDVQVNKQGVDLGAVFDRIKNAFQEQALAKKIVLRTVNTGLTVNTDPVLLQRCLDNLVTNAILHSCGSKILIGVKRRKKYVDIVVIDNGCGIEAHEQKNIFKEFHQLNNSERDRQKGLGLGLAIVKRTTDLLDHKLLLKSARNKGAAFYLTLPRSNMNTTNKPLVAMVRSKQLNGVTILVIDDEKDIREGMVLLLKQWGANVATASGADEVNQLIHANCYPDAIISDYRLPGKLTGSQLVEQLRASSSLNIPAMLITGDTAPERINEARDSGLLLMHKPINPAKLRIALTRILTSH